MLGGQTQPGAEMLLAGKLAHTAPAVGAGVSVPTSMMTVWANETPKPSTTERSTPLMRFRWTGAIYGLFFRFLVFATHLGEDNIQCLRGDLKQRNPLHFPAEGSVVLNPLS